MSNSVIYSSPIGDIILSLSDGGFVSINLPGALAAKSTITPVSSDIPEFNLLLVFLSEYFDGRRAMWSGRYIPESPPFFAEVWRAAARIPFGTTVSYGEVAAMAGKPGAARAAGSAMAQNPLPILVPCHRIIARDGGLGGYGGGLEMKRWLLRHEGVVV